MSPAYKREAREEAVRLYLQEEQSLAEVGRRLGVSKERVRQYLDELGVRRRGPGRRYKNG